MAGSTFTSQARGSKTTPVVTHQRLRRDYPATGDAAYATGSMTTGVGGTGPYYDSNVM